MALREVVRGVIADHRKILNIATLHLHLHLHLVPIARFSGTRRRVDRMEGDSAEHADLHADLSELRKPPPSLPMQRCASFCL